MTEALTAARLQQEVIAAIDHWENNEGSMDFLICDYLWPVLKRMIAAEAARIAKEVRVEALREALAALQAEIKWQNRYELDDDDLYASIQRMIDAETSPKGEKP